MSDNKNEGITVVAKQLAKNLLQLLLFYLAALAALYLLTTVVARPDAPVSGRARDEAVGNMFVLVLLYSGILFGYKCGRNSTGIGNWTYLLTNPFLVVCLLLIYGHLYDGPNWAGIAAVSASGLVSMFTSYAARNEAPRPVQRVVRGGVARRFKALDVATTACVDPRAKAHSATVSGLVSRMGIAALYVLAASPIAVFLAVAALVFAIAALVAPSEQTLAADEFALVVGQAFAAQLAIAIPLVLAAQALFKPGLFFYRVVRRIAQQNRELRPGELRALYLRRFAEDGTKEYADANIVFTALSLIPGLRRTMLRADVLSVEQAVINALNGEAAFVAVGKPGEWLPPLGGVRRYFPDEEWRKEVGALIDSSDLIFVVVDFSPAIEWELLRALDKARERLVVILPKPPRSAEWYEAWNKLGSDVPAISDETSVVTFPSTGCAVRINAVGSKAPWVETVAASIAFAVSDSERLTEPCTLNFGPRIRGAPIVRGATVILIVSILFGYVLPMLALDVMFGEF